MEQKPQLSKPDSKSFKLKLNENELTFVINAIHNVDIKAADAGVVHALQQRLIRILTGAPVEDELIETAVV